MIRHLKTAMSGEARAEDDAKTRATVESILQDIETRGDEAVRELSHKFDNYSPENFRLSDSEIEAAMSKVSTRDMDDIKFAQKQIRNFAEAQRASMTLRRCLSVMVFLLTGVPTFCCCSCWNSLSMACLMSSSACDDKSS